MSTFNNLYNSSPSIIKDKLDQLKTLRERPDYHPEPSAFQHIKIVVDRLAQTNDPDLIMAGFLHDICKLDCAKTNPKTGFPTSPGHDKAAYDFIMQNPDVMKFIKSRNADINIVAAVCLNHMKIHQLNDMRPAKRDSYIQQYKSLGIYDKLLIHGEADNMLLDFNIEKYKKN